MPSTAPLRSSIAWLLIAAVIVGGATGLARYLASHEHRGQALEALGALAGQAAAAAASDDGAAATAAPDAARVTVVSAGETDQFGIARDATVTLDEVRDPALGAADGAAMIDRSSAIEALVTERGAAGLADRDRYEATTVDGVAWYAASAPITRPDGAYGGMVRLAVRGEAPPDPVPGWRVLLGLLLGALSLGAALRWGPAARDRLLAGGVGALVAVAVLASASATLALWSAALTGLLCALLLRPTTDLLRGLREQPRTYVYVVPAVISMVVLVFVPFGMGVALAFFDSAGELVGFANFTEILIPSDVGDTNFYWTLFMTILWTSTNIILHVAIGLGLALVLDRPSLRFRGLYRVLLIVPWAVPNYITALIWKGMFNTQYGAVNATLAIFGIDRIDWLGDSVVTNFIANLVTNVWLGFPFMMVVSLGALQSIPKELYEAARIDGASKVQAFRHVTLPLLKPALVPAIILGTIWTFNMFNVIYLVSGGAPDGDTNILITEAYDAFKVLKRYGFAAAYSLLIFVILYAYGALTNRITKASEGAFE